MWGKRNKATKISTLIGADTELRGDVIFSGGLHVDGKIRGRVMAAEGASASLTLSERGTIEGDIQVGNVTLNGTVIGDVYATEKVELESAARVTGNVYYNLIEMAMGAEVNGGLLHRTTDEAVPLAEAKNAAPRLAVERRADTAPRKDHSTVVESTILDYLGQEKSG